MNSKYDHVWKILIVGNSGVGKSSLLLRFISNDYKEDVLATIGVDFKMKYFKIGDKTHKLALWDTAGQERFRGLTSSYYKGANGVIVMYDVTDRASFEAIEYWINEVKENCTTTPLFCIVGNKCDKKSDINTNNNKSDIISLEEGQAIAIKYSCLYLETSAKMNEGIDVVFSEIATRLSENADKYMRKSGSNDSLNLDKRKSGISSLCPC